MNIDNIKCFISLAECLNFTKAAEKEHVTQTSMSRRISSLETELGAPLFYRDNRMVELTAAGKVFYDQAKKLVEFYDQSVYIGYCSWASAYTRIGCFHPFSGTMPPKTPKSASAVCSSATTSFWISFNGI